MNELSTFNSLVNDLFGTDYMPVVYRTNQGNPRVDIKEDKDAYTLEMELPGRTENDIDIQLDHNDLTIASSKEECKKEEKNERKEKYILKERRFCSFERRFSLPQDVDTESIKATFANGILTVNMSKKPNAAPTKIAIMAS